MILFLGVVWFYFWVYDFIFGIYIFILVTLFLGCHDFGCFMILFYGLTFCLIFRVS